MQYVKRYKVQPKPPKSDSQTQTRYGGHGRSRLSDVHTPRKATVQLTTPLLKHSKIRKQRSRKPSPATAAHDEDSDYPDLVDSSGDEQPHRKRPEDDSADEDDDDEEEELLKPGQETPTGPPDTPTNIDKIQRQIDRHLRRAMAQDRTDKKVTDPNSQGCSATDITDK